MKKLLFIIPVLLITAVIILFVTSIKGKTKNDIMFNLNDSDEVEIIINIDSIINDVLNKDVLTALDAMEFVFEELEDIKINMDSLDFALKTFEDIDISLDLRDFEELEDFDMHMDSLDLKLDNMEIEIQKLNDSLGVKKLVLEIKKDVMDSLKCNMKKMKIEISENMRNMKDSLKVRMHRLKGDIHKDIRIKNLRFKDYKNMTDDEIINSLKDDCIIENENEVEINRNNGKVIIKITKTEQQKQ